MGRGIAVVTIMCMTHSLFALQLHSAHPDKEQTWSCPEDIKSNCPDDRWVVAMVMADREPGKVIVNIGCNKGNDVIRWMSYWDTHWDHKRWLAQYKAAGVTNYACPEDGAPRVAALNFASANSFRKKKSDSVGVCVEPQWTNVALLRKVSQALGYNNRTNDHGTFNIVQAAVADPEEDNKTVDFPDGEPGNEVNHLSLVSMSSLVPLKSVDGIVVELRLPPVDILLIDVEGFDPLVLRGASTTLSSVRYLEFEVHRDFTGLPWGNTTLKSVNENLYHQGFHCFWATNRGVLVSLNTCWKDSFDSPGVGCSNVACVKENDPWYKVMQGFQETDFSTNGGAGREPQVIA